MLASKDCIFATTINDGLKARMNKFLNEKFLIIATLLDPRYKLRGFPTETDRKIAKTLLESEMEEKNSDIQPIKKRKISTSALDPIGQFLGDFEINSSNETTISQFELEINQYLMDSHIARDSDPLVYWRNKTLWPNLQQMAKIYLAAPPSSVESERVFSTLGGIYKPKRTSLKEENAKKQLFLHHHL
uniref:HAT C-terminal dimerisation domain-containing protein n=4 Tax=Meloidogyne TaxID=189290 RepID=A0A6V7UZD5_MELEN|nr:unnamed protein product [Meloidogyne enterolobii]